MYNIHRSTRLNLPARLILCPASRWDLQCCKTTRLTAAADSANCDNAIAELFLEIIFIFINNWVH